MAKTWLNHLENGSCIRISKRTAFLVATSVFILISFCKYVPYFCRLSTKLFWVISKNFERVHSDEKIYWISIATLWNSTTVSNQTIDHTVMNIILHQLIAISWSKRPIFSLFLWETVSRLGNQRSKRKWHIKNRL